MQCYVDDQNQASPLVATNAISENKSSKAVKRVPGHRLLTSKEVVSQKRQAKDEAERKEKEKQARARLRAEKKQARVLKSMKNELAMS